MGLNFSTREAFNLSDQDNVKKKTVVFTESLSTRDDWKQSTVTALSKLCKGMKTGYLYYYSKKLERTVLGL